MPTHGASGTFRWDAAYPWAVDLLRFQGWLLDVRVNGDKANLLFRKKDGRRIIVSDEYLPSFYIVGANAREIAFLASGHPDVVEAKTEKAKIRLYHKEASEVVKLTISSLAKYHRVLKDIRRIPGILEIMESAVPHAFSYTYQKKLSFFSEYSIGIGSNLQMEKADGSMPRLRGCAIMQNGRGFLLLGEDGLEKTFESGRELSSFLEKSDVDVIYAMDGCKVHAPGQLLIDIIEDIGTDIYSEEHMPKNLHQLLEMGARRMIRIIELSSITGAGPEVVSSVSPGRLNTYLHMRAAKDEGFLIPDTKREMERPKTLRMLRIMDRGGTIFYPQPAIYCNVAKCDFASMYPNIIVNYNISPETMHCRCGKSIEVPEAGWKICMRRQGIIPKGIEKVVRERIELKKLMQKSEDRLKREEYNLRQRALKNILVTCFGYLGFKNFIFSNVECKECVMLFGREIMMRTKEIAEEMNLEVIYGMVDSIFVCGGSMDDYRSFVARASLEIGIELELDCIFRKIAFPAAEDSSGIANKYYGLSHNGKLEARGIGIRHSDAPMLIKNFQKKAIDIILAEGKLKDNISMAEELLLNWIKRTYRRDFRFEDFIIKKRLRRDLDEYSANAPHVAAARMLDRAGHHVDFIYSQRGPKPAALATKDEINSSRYVQLLQHSIKELTRGLEKDRNTSRISDFC